MQNRSSHVQLKTEESKIEERSEEHMSQEKSSKNSIRKPESKRSMPNIPKPNHAVRKVMDLSLNQHLEN